MKSQAARRSIGIITPSANVVVERTAIALMRGFPDVDLHFSRTPVAGSLDPHPDGYDTDAMLSAATLLAHARPGVILWAGSKGVLVGIERDRALCDAIRERTGIVATSCSLALQALRAARGLRRIGLVTPYGDAYQRRLIAGFERLGIACAAEAHAGLSDNLSYAAVAEDDIRRMARDVVRRAEGEPPEAVLAWCTNLAAAAVAGGIEAETGLPFYDATLLGLWHGLGMIGVDRRPARSWGSLFSI